MKARHRFTVQHRLVTGSFIYYFGTDSLSMARAVAAGLKRQGCAYKILELTKVVEEWQPCE